MKDIAVSDTRNFIITGHTGSGKTTLIDAILFKLGQNDRLGSVAAGSSMADYTDEEKNHKITMVAKPFQVVYKTQAGKPMNIVATDTPGYMDFFGQVLAAIRSTETGLVSVDATAGIQVGTRRAWRTLGKAGLSRAIVVTGMDRDNADFSKVLANIEEIFGDTCVPVMLPLPGNDGVVDILAAKEIPDALKAQVEACKNRLIELAAETNDSLIEKFLAGEALSADEISVGLRKAIARGSLIPIFVCMPLKDLGITELLEGVTRLFPSPLDREVKDAEGNAIATASDAPFAGFVWRTVNDPFVGQLTMVRVLGGTINSDTEVLNASKNEKERVGAMLLLNGKKQENVTSATAGDVVAIPKFKITKIGDSLCDIGQTIVFPPIAFPKPVVVMAVTAKTQADEDKIGVALTRVCDEDPTLQVERNRETKQILLKGLGDVHIDVAVEMMKRRSNVEVLLGTPLVAYRETVTTTGEGHYKHKKQSGGRGQYGEVYLRVAPLRNGDEEFFEDAIVGGVIPGNFVPAVQKGVVEGMAAGALAGYPVTGVKSSVYDGSYHDVDSSEIAFKIAGSRAFKEAMKNAKPVLLEPIMTVKVMIPDHHLGDINGDLNHKRGRIMGMGPEDGMQVITAEVPQSELFRYAAEIRSMTGGQGSFEMEMNRYDIVPSNIAQKIIAAAQKEKEE